MRVFTVKSKQAGYDMIQDSQNMEIGRLTGPVTQLARKLDHGAKHARATDVIVNAASKNRQSPRARLAPPMEKWAGCRT